jgi:RHS repeat-associated protein
VEPGLSGPTYSNWWQDYDSEGVVYYLDEGLESAVNVPFNDMLKGATPYSTIAFSDGVTSRPKYWDNAVEIELGIAQNGVVAPNSPEELLIRRSSAGPISLWNPLNGNDNLSLFADNQQYVFAGSRLVSKGGSRYVGNGQSVEKGYEKVAAIFSYENQYFVQVTLNFTSETITTYSCSEDDESTGSVDVEVVAQWLDAEQYRFLMDWDDGTTGPGTLSASSEGYLQVGGVHAYEWSENPYFPSVRYYQQSVYGWQWAGSFSGLAKIYVPDANHSLAVTDPTPDLDGAVILAGILDDNDPINRSYDYEVEIDWGDGSSSEGSISPIPSNPNQYRLSGFHVYNRIGGYYGKVTARATDNTTFEAFFFCQVNSLRPGANDSEFTLIHDRRFTADLTLTLNNLTTVLHSPTTNGQLTLNANGIFTYIPNHHFVGDDPFTYRLIENGISSYPITVVLHVINRAPVAANDSWYVSHDRRFFGNTSQNDFDMDADPFTATLLSDPSHGILLFDENGRFEYLPEAGFQGVDQFTYRLSDGIGSSSTATVTLNVGNHLPDLSLLQQYSARHDTDLVKDWPSVDPDGDTITASVKIQPTHGSVKFNDNGKWTYTPNQSYVGPDSFTFSIYDGLLESADALVMIDVYNHAPVGNNDQFFTPHDKKMVKAAPGVLANDSDSDDDKLTVTLVKTTQHGKIELSEDGGFTYIPDVRFVGTDSFLYVAHDGIESTEPIEVSIVVQEHAPVAEDLEYSAWPHDQTLIRNLNETTTDVDGDELEFELVTPPIVGTLVLQRTGEFGYSPPAGYTGTVSFSFTATDQLIDSNIAQVTITVVENAPSPKETLHTKIRHDSLLSRSVLTNVEDIDANEYLSAKLLTGPNYGQIQFRSDGSYVYQPNPGYVSNGQAGWDSFTFSVSDGRLQTIALTQTIDVYNTAPATQNDEYILSHNQILQATRKNYHNGNTAFAPSFNDVDYDGDTLQYHLVDPITGNPVSVESLALPGTLTWNEDGSFIFAPNPRLNEDVQFYYAATDGFAFSNPTRVLIHVQDTAPVAVDDTYKVVHLLQLTATRNNNYYQLIDDLRAPTLVVNDTNKEGDALTATLIDPVTLQPTSPSSLGLPGNLQWNGNGSFIYQPQPGFQGDVHFAYRLFDGVHTSNIAFVTIQVERPGPKVSDDHHEGNHDLPVSDDITINDIVHGNNVSIDLLDSSGNVVTPQQLGLTGTLTWSGDGNFTYQPAAGWHGIEQFRYRLFDGFDFSPSGLVKIKIINSVPKPTDTVRRVAPDSAYVAGIDNRTFRTPLLKDLRDAQGDTLTVALETNVQHGTLALNQNGSFQYTPNPGFRGTDGFTYRITDGISVSEIAQVSFLVTNRVAEAVDDSYVTYAGVPFEKNITYNDIDLDRDPIRTTLLDALTLQPIAPSAFSSFGKLELSDYGSLKFRANNGVAGSFTFAYSASDEIEGSDIGYVTIEVGQPENTNKPPVARNDTLSVRPGRVLTVGNADEWDGNTKRIPLGFNDRDLDDDNLTFHLVSPPFNGAFTLNADGSLSYTPLGANGSTDQFQYKLFDGTHYSNVATVTINVINHAPEVESALFTTPHGRTLTMALNGREYAYDADGDSLQFDLVSGGQHGVAQLQWDGSLTYVPNPGFVGTDTLTYRTFDGLLNSSIATIVIEVTNDRPKAFPASFKIGVDNNLDANVPAGKSDDVDPFVAVLAGGPFYGNVTLANDGTFTYTPSPSFVGRDTFTYYWQDVALGAPSHQLLAGNFATISIEVMSRPPHTQADVFNLSFGQPNYVLDVLANDLDLDKNGVSVHSFTQPTHGTIVLLPSGKLSYQPYNPSFYGTDTFTYIAKGRDYSSLDTKVTINVAPLILTEAPTEPQVNERQGLEFHLADLASVINPVNAADFQIDIQWGDGKSSTGMLVSSGSGFLVKGTHTYESDGIYTAKITVQHSQGYTVQVDRSIAVLDTVPLVTPRTIEATKLMPFQTVLATIVDDSNTDPEDYTVTVDWGDGTQVNGFVRRSNSGALEVVQGHMYAARGTFTVTVGVTDADGYSQTFTTTATVSHVVTVFGLPQPVASRSVDQIVGRFTSNSKAAQAHQFIATIDWGDGTFSPGMIVGENGSFNVHGIHTYAQLGSYSVTLLVTEDDPSQTTVHATDKIDEIGSTVRVYGRNLELKEDEKFDSSIVLGSFTDPDTQTTAAAYTVQIQWGDGQTSTGTVLGSAGLFTISGEHKYSRAGAYQIEHTVKKTGESSSAKGVSSLIVTGAALVGSGLTITKEGPEEVIATFVDPGTGSDFSARIRLAPGDYLPVWVTPMEGVTATTIADGQENNSNTSSPYEKQQLVINSSPTGGTFTLSFDGHTTAPLPHDATASDIKNALEKLNTVIDSVTVTGSNGSFVITFGGAHQYKNVSQISANGAGLTGRKNEFTVSANTYVLPTGNLEIQILEGNTSRATINSNFNFSRPSPSSSSSSGAHTPANPPQLNQNAPTLNVIEASGLTIFEESGDSFTGVVAKYAGNGDGWIAQINWGDGSTTDGTVSGGEITGSHTYQKPGTYRIAVSLRKPDPDANKFYDPWYYSWNSPWSYWNWNYYGYGWNYYPWWYGTTWNGNSYYSDGGWHGGVISGATISAPALSLTAANAQTGDADTELTDVTLVSGNASKHAIASIEWGDGVALTRTVTGGDVKGSHTYKLPGFYTARITVRDGEQLHISTVDFDIAPKNAWPSFVQALDPGNIEGLENLELPDVVLAKFELDTPRRIGGLHRAIIDWGDGTLEDGKIEAIGNGKEIVIKGTHTYKDSGAFPVVVTLHEQALTFKVGTTAVIDGHDITVTATPFEAAIGANLVDVLLGEFVVAGQGSTNPAHYRARVDLGDGASSSAIIERVGQKFYVFGSFTYIQTGEFTYTLTIEDGATVTRSSKASAAIRVGHAYEGGKPVDIFDGMFGRRFIEFDSMASSQDTHEWKHNNFYSDTLWSFAQTWDHYQGLSTLTESITWSNGEVSELDRVLPYFTFNTNGTLGNLNAWGWGNGYWYGWNTEEAQANGWWGQTGSLSNNPNYWFGLGWYGYGWFGGGAYYPGWYGPFGWNGYYGWEGLYDGIDGYWGWGGYWGGFGGGYWGGLGSGYWGGWGGWYGGWGNYQGPSTTYSDSGDWEYYGIAGYGKGTWSYSLSRNEATFGHVAYEQWDLSSFGGSSGAAYHDWSSKHYSYDWQKSLGNTRHVFEDDGSFNTSTTFGLSRTFEVADALIEAPHVRPLIIGTEDDALTDTILATFITSDWNADLSELSVEVDWGDGSSTTMAAFQPLDDQRIAIQGNHTYDNDGQYPITMFVRSTGGASRVLKTKANVNDPHLKAKAEELFVLSNESTGNVVVAVLDSFSGNADTLTATINWGDKDYPATSPQYGEKPYLSRGEIKQNPSTGKWEVWGQHSYGQGPTPNSVYKLTVEISDNSTQPLVVTSQAHVLSGWNASAQSRNQGFGESYLESVGGVSVSLNTGEILLGHSLDFDLNPGTTYSGNPQLVFNSSTTNPRPIIQALLESEPGAAVPTQFEARLVWDHGEPTAWRTYAGGGYQSGTDYLIAIQAPFDVRETGVYNWTIEVRIHANLANPVASAVSGKMAVVVQNNVDLDTNDPFAITAPFGIGWSLTTVDRLLVQENGDVIFVNGLGYPRLFEKPQQAGAAPYEFTGPVNEYGKLEFDPNQNYFTYTAKDQTRKYFNVFGLMYLIERPGLPNEFYNYDAEGRLVSIQTLDGAQTTLSYNDMWATAIHQPGGRDVVLTNTNGLLTSISEATGTRNFVYGAGNNLTSTNWGVLVTDFAYGAHGRLFQVDQGLGSVYQIYAAAVQGLQPVSQTTDQDLALFMDPLGRQHWYDMDEAGRIVRYEGPGASAGSPGQVETWERDDRFQITSHTGPIGTSSFSFDAKGNMTSSNNYGQGATNYSYDSKFNKPISVTDPSGNSTTYQLDSQTGFVTQLQNAAGGLVYNVYAGGLLMSSIGLNGATTNYQYDSHRRMVAELGPQNRNRYQSYDSSGNVHTSTDARGAVTTSVYDARNRLIQQIDALGNSTYFTYDASGLLLAMVEPNGRRTEYTYDRRGFQTAVTEGAGAFLLQRTSTATYDTVGNPIQQVDPQGFITNHAYDARNRRYMTVDANGGITTYGYNNSNQLVSVVDRAGHTWQYHYDSMGRQTGTTDPLGRTTAKVLGWSGNVLAEIDSTGRTTTHSYDALYRRVASTFNGQTTSFEYDHAGNVVRMTDPLGRQTVFSYDQLHNRTATADAMGNVWLSSYDLEGNAVANQDPLGHTSYTTYDLLRRPTAQLDPAGNLQQWVYDVMGNVISTRDPRGNWSSFTYDLHKRKIAETDALGNSNTYQYDLRDSLLRSWDRLGRQTSYINDELGQVVAVQDPSGGVWQFNYDMAGNTIGQTDPLGRVTSNTYDAVGRTTSATDALGNTSVVTYDNADNVLGYTDPLGRVTSFQYDNYNRRTKAIDPLLNETTWTYDVLGNLLSESRPLGRVTNFQYDALNRVTKVVDALGGETVSTYDPVGNVSSVTDALGRTTYHTYDALNRPTSITDPLGNLTTKSYDANGNVQTITDALSRTTTSLYDALNRPYSITDALGGVTSYIYDALGNVLSATNPAGETKTTQYDALNRPLSSTTPGLGTSSVTYDAVGNPISTVDGNGIVRTSTYDALNRMISTSNALGHTSQVVYDAVGNNITTVDPFGKTSSVAYDALNRPISSTDALGHTTSFTYDALGNRLSLIDPAGNTTSWSYDLLNRLVTETNELGHSLSYNYDAVGNRTSLTKRDGNVINYAYDAINRLTSETWLTSGTVIETLNFGYDAASQLLTATDATNSLSWSYDLLGRIANETQAITPVVIASMTNTYDSVGRRLQLATTVGGSLDSTIAYTIGAGGLVTQIQQYGANVASKSVTYSYDVGGRRTGVSRFAILTNTQLVAETSFDFDTIGRVTNIEHGRNNTPVASYAMVWDAGNRLTSVASLADGLSSFTYDDVHQLTSAVYTNHPNLSFSYDANGNRTGSGYSTGDDNQLLTDAQSSYQYDLNGNLIRRTNTATGAVTEYSYDHRDRLTTIRFRGSSSGPVTKQVNFDYDALNRRVAQSVDNNGDNIADESEYYVNDGLRSAREGAGDMLLLRLDSSGNVASRYLYGAAIDEILAEENIHPVTQASDVLWSLGDHIGSIRDVVRYNPATNTTQVANHLFYDAFGNIVSESDVNLEHRFAFTGREWDEEIDLQYNRARYYDPKMGRWISKDPLGFDAGDMNLYRYVGNQATVIVDPSGLWGGPMDFAAGKISARQLFDSVTKDFFKSGLEATHGGVVDTGGGATKWNHGVGGVIGGVTRYSSLGTLNSLTEGPGERTASSQIGFELSEDFVRAAGPAGITVPIYHGIHGESAGGDERSRLWATGDFALQALPTVPLLGRSKLFGRLSTRFSKAYSGRLPTGTAGASAPLQSNPTTSVSKASKSATSGISVGESPSVLESREMLNSSIHDIFTGASARVAPSSAAHDLAILNLQPTNGVASRSAAALSKVRGDTILQGNQLVVLKQGETLTIVAHGSPTSAAGMSAADLAEMLTKAKLSPTQIELCACKTGQGTFAQELADRMGVSVTAPKGNINVLSDIFGVPQVRDPITGVLRAPGELIETFEPRTNFQFIIGPGM